MLQLKNRLASCSSCLRATGNQRLRQLRFLRGTLADTLNTSSSAVRTRVLLLWRSAVRFAGYYVKMDIRRLLKPASTRSSSLLRHGLPLLVAVTLLLALGVVLLVKGLMSLSLTIR